jgi:hypothetical protein
LVVVEDQSQFPSLEGCLFCVLEKGSEEREFQPRHDPGFAGTYRQLRADGWYLVCVALLDYHPGRGASDADITIHASYPYCTLFDQRYRAGGVVH